MLDLLFVINHVINGIFIKLGLNLVGTVWGKELIVWFVKVGSLIWLKG